MNPLPPRARRWTLLSLAALALLSLGYATGRYAAPDKVVTVDRVVTVDKVVTVEKVRTVIEIAKIGAKQADIRYTRKRTKAPDGTVTDIVTREDKSREQAAEASKLDASRALTFERLVYQDRETTKLVERRRPQWSIAVQPGYDWRAGRMLVGGALERRITGPLFGGVWVNTSGAAGFVLRVEF